MAYQVEGGGGFLFGLDFQAILSLGHKKKSRLEHAFSTFCMLISNIGSTNDSVS